MNKKSFKWVAALVVFTVFCGVGKYLRDKYDAANLGLEDFTPADLFVDDVYDVANEREKETKEIVYKININTATAEQLCELKNIGEKTALRIIEFRNGYGRFDSIEELKLVEGIGDKTFSEISGYITVE